MGRVHFEPWWWGGGWCKDARVKNSRYVKKTSKRKRCAFDRVSVGGHADVLTRLQEVLKEDGVRLHVYCHDLNCIGFAGDLNEFGPQGPSYDVDLFHHDEHYDVITTMTGFLKKSYYCPQCDVGYSAKRWHKCRPFCECCYVAIADCSEEVIRWTPCPTCHRHFKSDVCYGNHIRVTTHRVQGRQERWSTCQRYRRCVDCQKWVVSDHRYHVHPIVDDDDDDDAFRFIFFDIETMPLEAVHRVNLIVAMNVCSLCVDWTNHDGWCDRCGERQVVFSTVDAFCTWLFRPEHQNATLFAHNFMVYDSYFLLEWLCARGQRPEVVMRGAKCMYMHVKSLNLKFKDSLCFLPMALRKFSKTFNLPEEKGYFPHFYNRRRPEHQDYVGPYPALEYYRIESMKASDGETLRRWYADQLG
ncbi:hypothetical protein QZH41_011515 [Actinostola sp. cb2023]|nr:hypothetical protein QZH41_011515 [Actinostola sp. cb2023]